jgi:murein DD-endopeptidase MepM/ murein hydrolase activator NlpD
MPARIKARNTLGDDEAGPIVAMMLVDIFANRKNTTDSPARQGPMFASTVGKVNESCYSAGMHRSVLLTLIGFTVVTLLMIIATLGLPRRVRPSSSTTTSTTSSYVANTSLAPVTNTNTAPANTNNVNTDPTSRHDVPMTDFFSRVTKKPFGIYITPATSPIQPEKFTGYHTGTDAETTAAEANVDIPIRSITSGIVMVAQHVKGYGGVIIIRSTVNSETVSILYGHLRISSFTVRIGDTVTRGQQIAVLGTGYTSETDGERKHVHVGIIKGTIIDYKGYVPTAAALAGWEDPVAWMQAHSLE